tara:strand:+ start:302 stop:1009 length:708 start_codon:yes stop_codon:yes gene_type:complete
MKLIIVIPAINHFFNELQASIYSLNTLVPIGTPVYIFDNGLTPIQLTLLENNFKFVDIKLIDQKLTLMDRKSYRFKSLAFDYLIKTNKLTDEVLLYMDSKTHLKYHWKELEKMLSNRPVWSGDKYGFEHEWTNIQAIEKMGFDDIEKIQNMHHLQAWVMLIDYNTQAGKNVLNDYIHYCKDDEIIYPNHTYKGFDTADPLNHRQDQSVFSLVIKKNNVDFSSWVPFVSHHNTMFS